MPDSKIMTRYTFEATNLMGSYSTMTDPSRHESTYDQALWDYNSARDHDGLPPLVRLPAYTKETFEVKVK